MINEKLVENIRDKFDNDIFGLKEEEDKVAYRVDLDTYSEKEVSSRLSELKEEYNFLYSLTIDDGEVLCLIVEESEDPRFYIHNILARLDSENYSEEYVRAEKISDGMKNQYSFESPLYIAILTIHMMKDYSVEQMYDMLDINEDITDFISQINEMKEELKDNKNSETVDEDDSIGKEGFEL